MLKKLTDPLVVRMLESLAELLVDPSSDFTGQIGLVLHYRQGVAGAAHLTTEAKAKLFGV